MNPIPIEIIKAAKNWEPDAIAYVRKHFEGYIISKSQVIHQDEDGKFHSFLDEDLRAEAECAILRSIANFKFREPPTK